MAPLIVLISSFLVSYLYMNYKKSVNLILSGNIAMSFMMIFTGVSHFIFTKGMALMIPEFIPAKILIVHLSGYYEIAIGIALLFEKQRKIAGISLIIFLICILPANILASIKRLNIQTAEYDGNGVQYLWFRIPLQLFFIAWIYFFSVNERFLISFKKRSV